MQHPSGIVIVLNKHSLSLIIHLYITQHDFNRVFGANVRSMEIISHERCTHTLGLFNHSTLSSLSFISSTINHFTRRNSNSRTINKIYPPPLSRYLRSFVEKYTIEHRAPLIIRFECLYVPLSPDPCPLAG